MPPPDITSDLTDESVSRRPRAPVRLSAVVAVCVGLASFVACTADQDARLAEVRVLHARGALSEVIAELDQILASDPDHAEANFMLGQVLLQTARPKDALSALRKAASDPDFARPAGLLVASACFDLRDYPASIAAANAVLEVDPTSSIALLTRGRSQLASGRPEDALTDADQILGVDANHQNATLLKSRALIALDRPDDAEKAWVNLHTRLSSLGRSQEAGRACVQLALFYRGRGDQDAADRTYQKCLAEYPTHAYLQRWASDFYIRRGETDRAIELHRNAVIAAPDDLRFRARLANVQLAAGKPEQAVATLEEAAERFDSSESWRILADYHLRRGDSDRAITALERAIKRSREPDQPALFSLADLLVDDGQIDRARAIGDGLTEPSYQHLLDAIISLHEGEPDVALTQLDAALALWPQNARAHFLAGEAASRAGKPERAVSEYRRALELNDRETDAALRLAQIEYALGRPKQALRFAQRQIVRRPYTEPAPYQIGIRSALAIGDVETARRFADRLEAIVEPDRAEADVGDVVAWLIERAAVERAQSGPAVAIDFVRSKSRNLTAPANAPLLRVLAEDLRSVDRTAEGLELIDAAITHTNDDPDLFDLRSRLLFSLRRFDESEAAADRALELDPTHAPALEAKAYLALERGEESAAFAFLEAAAEAAPDNPDYPYVAASIAREKGDRDRAISYLEQSLDRQPGYGAAAKELAWLLALEGRDLDRALALARTAATRTHNASTLDTLGFVRHQRGELKLAVTSFRSALERNPNVPAIRYRLGVSLAAMGEKEEARRIFETLLEGPAFPERAATRTALARLDES